MQSSVENGTRKCRIHQSGFSSRNKGKRIMENIINPGDIVLVHIRNGIDYSCESYRGEFEEMQESKTKGPMILLRLVQKDGTPVIREKDGTQAYRSLPRMSIKATRRNGRFVSCDVE
jgi:hypothetical protein